MQNTITDTLHPDQAKTPDLSGRKAYLARSQAKRARRTMAHYEEYWGTDVAEKRREHILQLPRKKWNGRMVFRVVCHGCLRARWEPESLLWAVLSLEQYRCAWCRRYGSKVDEEQTRLF